MKYLKTAAVAVLVMASGVAQAALMDRGGGLIYDTVLNVTWLQDANYAKTSGYDADGRMSWGAANTWAANLVFHDSVRNVDYSDWRLATNSPLAGGNWNVTFNYDGTTDIGYNITSIHSEMAYMYYVNLALLGRYSTGGLTQAAFGIFGDGTVSGQADVGLIRDLQAGTYWSAAAYTPNASTHSWNFQFTEGYQHINPQNNEFYAWAVRDGDVAAVPEPDGLVLAGLGMVSLISRRRALKGR